METKENNIESDEQILNNKKTTITKFFDVIDLIDRRLYGIKMNLFLIGCILVIIAAPFIDELLKIDNDQLTFLSTFVFFILVLILILAFISSWRDDNGNWTLERAKSRLEIYYEINKERLSQTKTNSKEENLYTIVQYMFFIGLTWKGFQNLSVFIRKPLENIFSIRLSTLRNFERFTRHYYWIVLAIGIVILVYLYEKNPNILKRVKKELRGIFGFRNNNNKYNLEVVRLSNKSNAEMIISLKKEDQINAALTSSKSLLFKDFVGAIQYWEPSKFNQEFKYRDKLIQHLCKYMPDADVRSEYPIGFDYLGSRGRADIIINDTILIEMKRDSSAGAIQRAKGQIFQYSEYWHEKGPVILVLCDFDYEKAKLAFSSTMENLMTLQRPALVFVARPKNEKIQIQS